MKAQILKIAGVKSEKEFYNKYPSEEAFMKVHSKAFKKAQIGTYIGGNTVLAPKPVNYQDYYDEVDKQLTGTTAAERLEMATKQATLAAAQKAASSEGGGGGFDMSSIMSMIGGGGEEGGSVGEEIMSSGGFGAIGGGIGSGGISGGRNGKYIPRAYGGEEVPGGYSGGYYPPPIDASLEGSPGYQYQQAHDAPSGGGGFMNTIGKLAGPMAGPVDGLIKGFEAINTQRKAMRSAKQAEKITGLALEAGKSRSKAPMNERRYVRPEDNPIQAGQVFPTYGVGTNVLARSGARLQSGGEIQNTYAPDYLYDDLGYEPLNDSNVKQYYHGGDIPRAAGGGGFSNFMGAGGTGALNNMVGQGFDNNAGYQIGSSVGNMASMIPGVGPVVGAIAAPVLGTVGGIIDNAFGDGRSRRNAARNAQRNQEQLVNLNTAEGITAGLSQIGVAKDGGYMNPEYNPQLITMFGDHTAEDFADYANKYRAGGHLKQYTPPSDRAMETYEDGGEMSSYAMGGQLQTHWGGKAETISHNPYMPGSGETVLFRGQSHTEADKNGQTGIGITYGESPVEVERGEPMFEMQSGGEVNPETGEAENTGVVFGNMKVDKKIAGQLDDPDLMEIANNYHGKKFKNIGIELAKQEARQNKIIDKSTKMLDSFKVETSLDKAKLAALRANMEGADTKLRNIANTKITLANYQNAINDAKDELSDSIGQNLSAEDLAKGYIKLDKDPVTMDAKWGGNIAKKAKDGVTTTKETTVAPKTFNSKREAEAAGYYKDAKGNWTRTIKKYSTKTDNSKAATAMDNIPAQKLDKNTGFAGGVTKEKFEEFKKRFPDYPGIDKLDPKDPISLNDFKTWANTKAKEMGSTARIMDDPKTEKNPQGLPIFGNQYLSFTIDESKKSNNAEDEEKLTATVNEPGETPIVEEKAKFPWLPLINQAVNNLRPSDEQGLDLAQLYPEMYALSNNQVEPVPAQGYQPDLLNTYDISYQDQLNANQADYNASQKLAQGNPAYQAILNAQKYAANTGVLGEQFRANQAMDMGIYNANTQTLNDAKLKNLSIFDQQYGRQSEALSNTKATTQAALNSIADKYAKNKLENRKLTIYENMYNYRFGKSGRAQNYNPLQIFDTGAGGSGSSDKSGGLAEGKEFTYDKYGNIVGVRSADKDSVSDADLEAVGGIKNKNGGYTKIKSKNGSILRDFKNL